MTQLELANALGIEPVNVSRWERGVAEPKLTNLRELAKLAEVPVSWFFGEREEVVA
jgi:transcriptional regulator with XRE-family HTH domain